MTTTPAPPRTATFLDTTARALLVLATALFVAGASAAGPPAPDVPAGPAGNAEVPPAARWTGVPLETLGDDHRVREGHVGAAGDAARDADAASAGTVVGTTPAHDALRRSRGAYDLAWVADVGVLLRGDDDGDRYFGTLELTIDVDTESVEREVYAVIELTEPDGTLTLRHATGTFTIRGNAVSDRYRVEIELLDNHRAAERDAYIEIRDGWNDAPLDSVSAYELASLAALPLESERPFHPVRDDDGHHPDGGSGYLLGIASSGSTHGTGHPYGRGHLQSETYVAGYAGAAGPFGALAPLLLLVGRRRTGARRRRASRAPGRWRVGRDRDGNGDRPKRRSRPPGRTA